MTDSEGRFANDGPIVTVAWLRERLGAPGVRVVDARPQPLYAAVHIPGAFNLDPYALRLPDSSPAAIARFDADVGAALRRVGVRPGERVLFYEDVAGTAAAYGVWLLDYAGHRGGALLDGGLAAWVRAGGELTRDVPTPAPSDLRLTPDRSVLATADEILAGLGDPDAAPFLLDARNAREHAAGTIPGAVPVEWLRHLAPDGMLRRAAELRDLYAGAGLLGPNPGRSGRAVVTYCGSGYRSTHAYVVLKALGHPRVKHYAPSWGEWGRRPDLPVMR